MTEFVALLAKLYAYRTLEKKKRSAAKALKNVVAKKSITFADYKECLDSGKNMYRSRC